MNALGGKSRQEFDAGGMPTKLVDPNGHETHWEFDQQGRFVREQVGEGATVRYSYDAQDLLKQVRNGRGQVRELEYDAAGRLIKLIEPEGTVSYSYDANGNVLTVTDHQGTIARTYDALNRVMTYTDVRGKRLHYAYDEVGHLVKLTYPDGREVEYDYDGADQLVKVKDWAGRVTSYEYDGNGRLVKEVLPNGTMRSRRYDEAGRVVYQGEWDGEGRLISEFQLSYDAIGNIVREESLPKLESISLPMPVTMSYSDGNQLATYQGQAVRLDADGNLVWGPVRERMEELRFDSRNRLVEAGGVRYHYDAENQRIGVNETRYVVNSQPLLSQVLVKEEGGRETFYVYGLGLIGEEREGRYWSYHFDVRGSTVALSDEEGEVVERFGYGPYGELVSGNGGRTPFLFNGMFGVMSDGNGLYYMRARFYSPAMKRFVNRDVVVGEVARGQSLNRLAFVEGNPINFVDPEGKWLQWVIWGVGIGLFLYDVFSPIEPDFSGLGTLEEVWTIPGPFKRIAPWSQTCKKTWRKIKGTQVGFKNAKQIDQIKMDMLSGKYEYTELRGKIGGQIDSEGNFYVGEGHHRVAAAMEIYKETGDDSYINKLLENGIWDKFPTPPINSRPLPSRNFWDNLRNWLGF